MCVRVCTVVSVILCSWEALIIFGALFIKFNIILSPHGAIYSPCPPTDGHSLAFWLPSVSNCHSETWRSKFLYSQWDQEQCAWLARGVWCASLATHWPYVDHMQVEISPLRQALAVEPNEMQMLQKVLLAYYSACTSFTYCIVQLEHPMIILQD